MIFITLDGTPPVVNITQPVQGTILSSGSEIVLEGYIIEEIGVYKLELVIDDFDPMEITEYLGYSKWRYTLENSKSLPGGEIEIKVKVTDFVGLEHESNIEIFIDKELPTIEIVTIENPILIGNTMDFHGSAADDIGIYIIDLLIDDDHIGNFSVPISSEETDWSYTWNITGYSEGEYDITAMVTDLVGKSSENEITLKLISKYTDTDSDGMPDWWELLYEKLDWSKNDAVRDYDQDGFSNLDEYLGDDGKPDNDDHSDPMDRTSVPNIKEEETTDSGSDLTAVWIGLLITVILILIILFMFIRIRAKGSEKDMEDEKAKDEAPIGNKPIGPPMTNQQQQSQMMMQMKMQIPGQMQMQKQMHIPIGSGPAPLPPGPMPPIPPMPPTFYPAQNNMQQSSGNKISNEENK
jgi:hypothetical protein